MSDPLASSIAEEDPPSERMSFSEAVIGQEIYNFSGGQVLEHITASGHLRALKVRPRAALDRSEADIMHYAAIHGVLAPKVYGVYDVETKPRARVMVSDRLPGVPLADIWQTATKAEQTSYKNQLRQQIASMRECTQPFIGRLTKTGEPQSTYNVFERLPIIPAAFFGPFKDEKEFDTWCLNQVIPKVWLISRYKWNRFIQREQRNASGRFVLTHGDLTPRNIMAENGVITGIVDWEKAGFFPEYAEYAFAMKLSPGIEKWWIPVLKEILRPCSNDRLKFTKLVEDRGW